jgi:predicted nuclease with TOPRIM domain
MDALNARLADLEKRQHEINNKKYQLESEEYALERERAALEEERLNLSQKMSPHEEDCLKKELTALGELLELPAVIVAYLDVVSETPSENPKELYTIQIDTAVTSDSGVTGLCVRATIKTVCPKVESIVRSLFVQEGYVRDRTEGSLTWERHWDYSTRIRLTTHEALSW